MNLDHLEPLLWIGLAGAAVVLIHWLLEPERRDQIDNALPVWISIIAMLVLPFALLVLNLIVVDATYDFFRQIWPHSWVWAALLLVIWVPLAVLTFSLFRLSDRQDHGEPSTLALLATTAILALGGIFSTFGQWIAVFDHAYAPITFGTLCIGVGALWLISKSNNNG